MRRVVVTGLGMLSPLGNTPEQTWENLLLGKSGIRNIDHFDTTEYSTKFAGLVNDFDAQNYMEKKKPKKWIFLFNMVLPQAFKQSKILALKLMNKTHLVSVWLLALVLAG